MTTNNPTDSINHIPLLSQEMERTLRRLAWKDEDFREALIADPKEIIQQVFPHCFPNGKLPNNLTINVIEEDAYTHHIVLPSLLDETLALEIPEEEQLDLLFNLGRELGKFNNDHAKMQREQSTDPKTDFTRRQFNKENQAPKEQEYTSGKAPYKKASSEAIEKHLSDGHTFKVIQNTADTHHIILRKLPDAAQHPGVSENELLEHADNIMPNKRETEYAGCTPGCTNGCNTPNTKQYCSIVCATQSGCPTPPPAE